MAFLHEITHNGLLLISMVSVIVIVSLIIIAKAGIKNEDIKTSSVWISLAAFVVTFVVNVILLNVI